MEWRFQRAAGQTASVRATPRLWSSARLEGLTQHRCGLAEISNWLYRRDFQAFRHCGRNHKICQHSYKVTYKSISARLSLRTWGASLNDSRKWQKCEGQPLVEAFCPQWKDAVKRSFSSAGIFARVRPLSVVLANIWLKQTDIWAGNVRVTVCEITSVGAWTHRLPQTCVGK